MQDIGEVSEGATAAGKVGTSPEHLRRCYALIQGRRPPSGVFDRKTDASAREVLVGCIKSKRLGATIERFLTGTDRDDPETRLTPALVGQEVLRVANSATPLLADEDLDGPALSWRQAFLAFWTGLGESAARPYLDWVAAQSPDGAEQVARFDAARERIAATDALVDAGEIARAWLEARAGMRAGLTCFAARYAVLGMLLAPGPRQLGMLQRELGGIVSDPVLALLRRLLQAGLTGTAGPDNADLARDLPPAYAARFAAGPAGSSRRPPDIVGDHGGAAGRAGRRAGAGGAAGGSGAAARTAGRRRGGRGLAAGPGAGSAAGRRRGRR